jgi:hypothetical protein
MGEARVDSFAMEAVADSLAFAASDIELTGLNWPEQQEDSECAALDLHAECARLWAAAVADRLEVWAKRARQIANALERQEGHRRAVDNFSADSP